jgi:hypothetical protein
VERHQRVLERRAEAERPARRHWVQSLALVLILWDVSGRGLAIHAGLQAYVLGAYVAVGGAIANYFGSNPSTPTTTGSAPARRTPTGSGSSSRSDPGRLVPGGYARHARWRRILKPLDFAFIPAAFIGLALAGTRTAAVAGIVGMGFGLASLTRLRPIARIAILGVLTYAFFALLPVVQPLASFQRLGTTANEATEGDLNGRLSQWSQGLDSFHEHPLVGVGANMYRTVNTLGRRRTTRSSPSSSSSA